MNNLSLFLQTHAHNTSVSYAIEQEAAHRFGCTLREVEAAVFNLGLTPLRYIRNQHTLTQANQSTLFYAHVFIAGCGGLGGLIIELLARVGIGNISFIDQDSYEEHNLNRQIFSSLEAIGHPKVKVIQRTLKQINPIVQTQAFHATLDTSNVATLVQNCDVAIDALDCPSTKKLLSQTCVAHKVPFVHGAIGGWMGQCTTSPYLEKIYRSGDKGAEVYSGNLPMTAATIAAWQASLALKLLLQKPALDETLLMVDLFDNAVESISLT
jgi:molybdopterin/thiamine biosynthesis adenylyltransferase